MLRSPRWRDSQRPGQPPAEILIGARSASAWPGVGGDRPGVGWPSALVADPGSLHQPRLLHPLEVNPHAIGMQVEALGQLDRSGRSPELSEERKQA